MHKVLHPRDNVDNLYIERELISIKDWIDFSFKSMCDRIKKDNSHWPKCKEEMNEQKPGKHKQNKMGERTIIWIFIRQMKRKSVKLI